MIPWFERPTIFNVRARPNVIQSTSGSRDLQMVRTCCWRLRMLFSRSLLRTPLVAGEHRPSCADPANPQQAA